MRIGLYQRKKLTCWAGASYENLRFSPHNKTKSCAAWCLLLDSTRPRKKRGRTVEYDK